MGFRINTNIAAMNSHRNAVQTNMGLDKSLASLSSGLRINVAADDASGMTIADSLRSQAQGLGQAINNANDGVAVVQTADGALDEYINIINTVRTKSIQAASDGQNADSRAAIQRDIDRLLEAADGIANQTQFNGQKLLDGTFSNKAFHIGAYAGETVNLSVGSVQTDSVGDIASINNDGTTKDGVASWTALSSTTITETGSGNILDAGVFKVNGEDISSVLNQNSPQNLMNAKALSQAITDATGLLAQGTTTLKGTAAMGATTLNATNTLKINGFQVADGTYLANDSDGGLVRAINDLTDKTGVVATNNAGTLELVAADGRNISISTGGTVNTNLGDHLTDIASTATVAGLSTTATAVLTFTEGEVIINGVDLVGSYGDGTAGSAAQQLQAAIRNIDGMEESTVGGTVGGTNLVVNNGDDLNIAGSNVVAELGGVAEGVFQESEIGLVDIFSDDKVVIGGALPATNGFTAGGYTPQNNGISLESINVLDRNSAEVAILIADSALKTLDATRSDLGSVQNQLESTIRNISVTQINVTAAESQIRDVDFAAESANFAKLNILAQSGSYAMSQANAVQQNVMRLLQ